MSATIPPEAIDDLKAHVDLRAVIAADLGEPKTSSGRAFWPCPFHTDRDPSLVINPDGATWKCFGCDAGGDVIAWVMQRKNLAFLDAYKELGGEVPPEGGPARSAGRCGSPARRAVQRRRPAARPAAPPAPVASATASPPTWAPAAALAVVDTCEAALWTDAGAKMRAWLAARGIREATARAWGLGYNPAPRAIQGLQVHQGLVIPSLVDGSPWYLKVRRPVPPLPGPKYQHVKGGGSGALFGLDHLAGRRVVVICEGELDAILLWQEAHDLVDVVTAGSTTTRPALPFLARLLGAAWWLVALDTDPAGEKGAAWWGEYSARVHRVRPLQGKDITDFHQAGGDLRAWVSFHLARLDAAASNVPRPADLAGQRTLLGSSQAASAAAASGAPVDPDDPATWLPYPDDLTCPRCGGRRWGRNPALAPVCMACDPSWDGERPALSSVGSAAAG